MAAFEHRSLSHVRRRLAVGFAEASVEVTKIAETAAEGDFADGFLRKKRHGQAAIGQGQPFVQDEARERRALGREEQLNGART